MARVVSWRGEYVCPCGTRRFMQHACVQCGYGPVCRWVAVVHIPDGLHDLLLRCLSAKHALFLFCCEGNWERRNTGCPTPPKAPPPTLMCCAAGTGCAAAASLAPPAASRTRCSTWRGRLRCQQMSGWLWAGCATCLSGGRQVQQAAPQRGPPARRHGPPAGQARPASRPCGPRAAGQRRRRGQCCSRRRPRQWLPCAISLTWGLRSWKPCWAPMGCRMHWSRSCRCRRRSVPPCRPAAAPPRRRRHRRGPCRQLRPQQLHRVPSSHERPARQARPAAAACQRRAAAAAWAACASRAATAPGCATAALATMASGRAARQRAARSWRPAGRDSWQQEGGVAGQLAST